MVKERKGERECKDRENDGERKGKKGKSRRGQGEKVIDRMGESKREKEQETE